MIRRLKKLRIRKKRRLFCRWRPVIVGFLDLDETWLEELKRTH